MKRNLRALGLCLVAAFALSAVASSAAQAEITSAAKFTAAVGAGETAKVDATQIGTNTFTLTGLPPLTCGTANATGPALTAGASSTEVTLTPTYATCHILINEITKLVTVTVNGCAFKFNATTTNTSGVFTFPATTSIECPTVGGVKQKIEIHVYNSATLETETLCTFTIAEQGPLKGITLTNEAGTPDDVVAHIDVVTSVVKVSGSALVCGPATNTATYLGTQTLRATNEAGTFVNATVSE